MAIVRLIYFSEFRVDINKGTMLLQVNDILDSSRRNNYKNNITGALVFDDNWFIQVLEGAPDDVWTLYKKIELDRRHANIQFLEMRSVPTRRFGNWLMGFAERVGKHAAIFAPYLYNGKFEPSYMTSELILSLMLDLSSNTPGWSEAPTP